MCSQLESLELSACQGMISNDDYKNQLDSSKMARQRLESEASAQYTELSTNLLSNNSSQEGIITFFKPNVTLVVYPEPINLKEALQYLINHEDYESTGFELYDFIGESVNVQFDKIMKILRHENRGELLEPKSKKLSFQPYLRMKDLYYPDSSVKYKKLVDSMAPIIKTSTAILEQVISGSIKVTHSTGTNFIICRDILRNCLLTVL
jgi:hypothetical protein